MKNKKYLELSASLIEQLLKVSVCLFIFAFLGCIFTSLCLLIYQISIAVTPHISSLLFWLNISMYSLFPLTILTVIFFFLLEQKEFEIFEIAQENIRKRRAAAVERFWEMTNTVTITDRKPPQTNNICTSCKYYSGDHRLICAVNPLIGEEIDYCKDWEEYE